ncbi:MAG: hypothetical protein FKY71_19910 [Spiribacter salinus]|uniref:BCCT family transporter n=1 Tax=Spiribacter salinus TaxID=1335746 RepID=A0A540V6Y7_9GAMM|nr:MAG: hypothetical protein FKY71_19910 [Spiribacter salinus]
MAAASLKSVTTRGRAGSGASVTVTNHANAPPQTHRSHLWAINIVLNLSRLPSTMQPTVVPVLITFLWLTVFGGTGLHGTVLGESGIEAVVQQNASAGLYAMLDQLPLQTFTSILATLMVVVFFVTSSDSGSLVDDMVTSGGHPHPPKEQRIFWAVAEGTVAATLLLSGGLQALRD